MNRYRWIVRVFASLCAAVFGVVVLVALAAPAIAHELAFDGESAAVSAPPAPSVTTEVEVALVENVDELGASEVLVPNTPASSIDGDDDLPGIEEREGSVLVGDLDEPAAEHPETPDDDQVSREMGSSDEASPDETLSEEVAPERESETRPASDAACGEDAETSSELTTPIPPEPDYHGWYNDGDDVYYFYQGSALSGWLVTDTRPDGVVSGLERYWLDPLTFLLLFDQLIDVGDGAWAYARPEGFVVRGKYCAPNGVWYLADDDGRLEHSGWLVTDAFDGRLERYYIDPEAHGAIPGHSTAGGWWHYTRGDGGFVARGKVGLPDGRVLLADDEGQLMNPGWLVTAFFDGHDERYYVENDGASRIAWFQVDGRSYYAIPYSGYVVRGKHVYYQGAYRSFILADNDGVMESNEGWLVTGAYDGGVLQRYRLDYGEGALNPFVTARTGWFSIDGYYYGVPETGYVARGFYRLSDGSVVVADNDGHANPDVIAMVIAQTEGLPDWLDANYAIPDWVVNSIAQAVNTFIWRGWNLSFVMVDLTTGNRISYGPNRTIYGASTMKASYCTWVLSQLVDTGRVPFASVADRIERTIRYSDNDAYLSLRRSFGSAEFVGWLDYVGQGDKGVPNYPWYTARDLSRIWSIEARYLLSGQGYSQWLRSLHTHSANSSIDQVVDWCEVYTKAGWISEGAYWALNDAGIIENFNGRPVLLTILTSAGTGNNWALHQLIRALAQA